MTELEGELASTHSVHSHASGSGASIVQVELGFGKSAVVLILFAAFISALAFIGLVVAFIGYGDNVTELNVLQYDLAQIRAQLIDQGLYDATGH